MTHPSFLTNYSVNMDAFGVQLLVLICSWLRLRMNIFIMRGELKCRRKMGQEFGEEAESRKLSVMNCLLDNSVQVYSRKIEYHLL